MSIYSRILNDLLSTTYTAFYCEENVWQLCRTINNKWKSLIETSYCVFVTNDQKKNVLYYQKLSKSKFQPVIWDYHVVFLMLIDNEYFIFDKDSLLSFPCPAKEYFISTFTENPIENQTCESVFRLVEARDFLKNFASDRSHMMVGGQFLKDPPNYCPIKTENDSHILDKYLSTNTDANFGKLLSFKEMKSFISLENKHVDNSF